MIFYFRPKLQGQDVYVIDWEAPTLVEKFCQDNLNKKCWADFGKETGVRTMTQNSALHLYFELVAKELNAGGLTIQEVLKNTAEISWTGDRVKELIWRPIQKSLVGKESTTTLDKVSDIDTIYEHVNLFLGEKCEVHIPFPSIQTKNG